jgi:hypothetical protein
MRKLRLDVEMLVVESFATAGGRGGNGTVRGHDDSTVVYPGGPVGRRSDDPADCSMATCGDLYSCYPAMFSQCCTNDHDWTCDTEDRRVCAEPDTGGTIG